MSDQDREAFEADCQRREVYTGRHREFSEQYQLYETQLRWMGWQAAAAHYAPRLTEAEAVEKAARALAEIDCSMQAELRKIFNEPDEDEALSADNKWTGYLHEARAALRAAGVRFKEEASSNPEPGSCQ